MNSCNKYSAFVQGLQREGVGQDQVHGTGGADLGTEDTGTQNFISKADSISFGLKMMAVGERGPVIWDERYEGLVGREI